MARNLFWLRIYNLPLNEFWKPEMFLSLYGFLIEYGYCVWIEGYCQYQQEYLSNILPWILGSEFFTNIFGH